MQLIVAALIAGLAYMLGSAHGGEVTAVGTVVPTQATASAPVTQTVTARPDVNALSDLLAAEDAAAPAVEAQAPKPVKAAKPAKPAKVSKPAKTPKSGPRPLTGAQIEAALEGIPQDHECVLQTADATVYGMAADTDPQCARWWGTDGRHAPKVAPFTPTSAGAKHAAPRKTAGTRTPPNVACVGDKVCIEVGIPVEDGGRVLPSFWDHVTTSGATQARCDYLGKQRVADATYGHRCV